MDSSPELIKKAKIKVNQLGHAQVGLTDVNKEKKSKAEFKPEYNDKGEYQGPLTQLQRQEKRQYIKGMLVSNNIKFHRITIDANAKVMVEIDSNWCEEQGYKCDKDGNIDKKFLKMLEEKGIKYDTITFSVRDTKAKENPEIVHSLESFQDFSSRINEDVPVDAKRLYRKTRADGAFIKRSKFSILTLADKELAFDPELLEAIYNNGGVWIDEDELIPYIMPKDQKPEVENAKWYTCDGSGDRTNDYSVRFGDGGGIKKRIDRQTGEEFWSAGSGHRLTTKGRLVDYRRTHYVPRGGLKYREKEVEEEIHVVKGDRVKVTVTDDTVVTTEIGDIVRDGEYEGVAVTDDSSGEVSIRIRGGKYDKEIMYVPLDAIELIV
jgi:hypothetical protein